MQQDDLLKIYAKSNLVSLSSPLLVMTAFISARIWLYGVPQERFYTEIAISCALLFASFLMFMMGRKLYAQVLMEKPQYHAHVLTHRDHALRIAIFNAIHMCLWLYFLFMPINGQFYEHLLGYLFVFCAIGIYAATSSSYFPLMLSDIGVPVLFALFVTFVNRDQQEMPYLAGVLLVFGAYAAAAGYKNSRTTRSLVESRRILEKMAQSARLATNAKTDFLAVMSHEIRTPMTGILGMIDFLSETNLTKEQKASVGAITECSKTLLNTLNDILDLSRIEAGKLAINNTNMDLHSVAQNTVTLLEKVAQEKNLELRFKIASDVPRHMHGDPHRIRQAMMNLINNAIKFTEKGHVELAISFKDSMIHIAVEDTGIGISPDQVKNLFNTFSQADSSISRQYGGSGLGLSITKRLVEMMNGRIGVTSQPGSGSSFWFDIPYKEPIHTFDAVVEDQSRLEIPPQNILLVEDNQINQMICSRILEKKGHHVTIANDGETALEMARNGQFDLIFMDCNLPGRNGFDTARQIKAMKEKYDKVPIIALTANGMESQARKCKEAGMIDCILKPYEPARIYEAMALHLGYAASPQRLPSDDKLKSIMDEMGEEYMLFLIKRSLEESERLLLQMFADLKKQDYTGIMQGAHDMRSVCGAVGMKQCQELAVRIEEACIHNEYAKLHELLSQLEDIEKVEHQALERAYLSQ